MCYMAFLSTDCADDLSQRTSDRVRFERPSAETDTPCPPHLKSLHNWFLGSKAGCSCTFRHLSRESVELGFGAREDWYPEEEDELVATRELYETLRDLVQRGHHVELLDCWSGEEGDAPIPLEVSVSEVPVDHFRLFEGYLFTLKP